MYRLIAAGFAAAATLAAGTTTTLMAQEAGAVRGTVTLEENGGPVHGGVILVVGSGAFALTDEQGMFEIDNIPAGSYEVLAQREHLTAGRQTVTVEPGGAATVDFVLGLSPVHEDVTVTASVGGTETTFEAFNAVTTLDSFDITRESAGSLGDALRNEPGIASRSFGPGSSRPIIRGFDGDRVLILEDGLRTGDLSSQSGDHGVTIDPNGAERIEIVRGPATLLYGSNAVGGLVNVITPHESYRESLFDGTRAQFGTNVGSANAEAGTTASLQYSQNNVLVWGGGSMRRTDDYNTPAGAVENSASELTNARAGLGWFGDRFFASSGFTLEDGRYGVPFADQFHMAHGVHGAGTGETEIDIASRRRVGRFDMGLRNLANTVIEGVRVALNVIDWNHDELEVEDGIENIGTRFTNRTYIMRADVDQRQTGRLSGRFGAWTQFRDFEAVGVEALAPRTDQTSFAAFAYEEIDFRRARLQFGGRVEQNDYRTAGRIVPDAPADDHGHAHGLEVPDARDRQFLGASASVGLHTDVGAGSAFVANLTHSHRAPALEELYNFGPHVGNLAFEVGNPNLDGETTLGLDVSLRHQADRVRSNVNAYIYSIDNFIFGDRTGEVEDNLPVWNFLQSDSRFVGVDARSSVRLGGNAWATLGIGYVDATLTTTGEPLPRIPPLRGTLSLDVPYGGFTLSPQLEFAGRQADVFRDETETNGYSVVNLRASYVWPRQHAAHILSFTGYNLTNELYRNHTSFIKDLAPEMGRGVRVNYSVRFF
ncbi:MAG: TonB-dependent receptor [Acidobacteria bacterium]|nr:TonB-dependent receptor [Acidobacteriota bacterium]